MPADALTASGSGLDPHISLGVRRAPGARASPRPTGCRLDAVERLIEEHTEGRGLGFLGEPGVNVLELNLAVGRRR